MRAAKRLLTRLYNLVSHRSGDERFLEEMEEHLSRQTEDNLRSGMTPAEARRQAILQFGAVEALREQYHAEKIPSFIESVLQDVRYSLRILGKSWGFTSLAAISLALAIGAKYNYFFGDEAPTSRSIRCAAFRATPSPPVAWRQEHGGDKHVGDV